MNQTLCVHAGRLSADALERERVIPIQLAAKNKGNGKAAMVQEKWEKAGNIETPQSLDPGQLAWHGE